jgi:PAS domain S-box-containing protein
MGTRDLEAGAAFTAELIESIADGVSVVDETGTPILVNEAFCAMTGYPREELMSGAPMSFPYWPPEEREAIARAFEGMLAGDHGPFELVFARKSGERFPCRVAPGQTSIDGRTLYIATVRDLSEERQREARVEELARLVDTMLTAGDLATWEWHLVEDRVTVSDSWYTALGEVPGPRTITTGTLVERVHPDDFAATQREIEGLLANQVRLYEVEHRLRMADGEHRWFLARGFITERDPDGKPLRIGGTNPNIHQLKLQEEHLRQFQKMDVLGQLVGGIAHDFNNVLAVLQANLGLLRFDALPEQHELLADMGDAVHRASNLTRSLLRYARKEQPETEPVDVASFVRSAKSVLSTATSSVVRLRLELDEAGGTIAVEPTALENALLNLVVNARDASREVEDATVTVSTGHRAVSPAEAVELGCRPGPYVRVTVADEGVGMTGEVRRRATEPLFTTKGAGTGLGLSMVQRFVRDAGGFLHIDSAPGEGTRVTLGFPRTVDSRHSSRAPAVSPRERPERLEAVLVVDDDDALVRSLSAGLEALGYRVLGAHAPRQALEQLAEHEVDVLVTDITLPYALNGIGLAHRARTLRPGMHVVFMTGFAGPEVEAEARELGPVLRKPFDTDALAALIRAEIEAAEGHPQPDPGLH